MEIRYESLLEGARKAEGVVVIVDVFRAFTTAAIALERGVEKIIFVAEPDEALMLRQEGVADICVGEVGGIPPPGFDYGNSPFELSNAQISGQVMAHSTRAGTVGVTAVQNAEVIFGASLINAQSTIVALREENPERVTIVAMGLAGKVRTDEDEICAMYLRNLLEGRTPDIGAVRDLIRGGREVVKFMDPSQPHFHPEDIEYALRVNEVQQPIRIVQEEGHLITRSNRLTKSPLS